MTRKLTDSGIAWIGKIPTNWSIMPNKYLMWKKKRICPIYNGEDIISLSMNGVIVRDLDAGGKMPATFDGYQYIENGNLLMCLYDIDVTPRCIGLIKCNGLTSPSYSQFVLTDIADAAYYNYYYTMLDNDKVLVHLAKNLRHSLTEDQLGRIATVVPPIDEQRKIAAFLDEKCSEIDSLIVDIQYEINKLERLKQSVITEAVTKGIDKNVSLKDSGIAWIGKIPTNWSIMPNKYLMWKKKRICPIYNGEDIISLSMNGVIVRDLDAGGKMPATFDGYQYIENGNLLMCLYDIDVTPRCIGLIKCKEAIRETENLNDGEVFLVKDLFKGYVGNRIPRKDRLLLGTLFLNHVSKMNGNLKAIEKTSSNQQRYKKTIDKF